MFTSHHCPLDGSFGLDPNGIDPRPSRPFVVVRPPVIIVVRPRAVTPVDGAPPVG